MIINEQLLSEEKIHNTLVKLSKRIKERFPTSSLYKVSNDIVEISKEAAETIRWIESPNYFVRIGISIILVIISSIFIYSICQLNIHVDALDLLDVVQVTESTVNELVIIAAGTFSLYTFDTRRKRRRVIRAINELRSISHIIDAHQLTKDPIIESKLYYPTDNSPKRDLSRHELKRYLNYCSEMLSLTSKVGFLYIQKFDDPTANDSVNDLEVLTTGLSRKIWQKIMILEENDNYCDKIVQNARI
ncbi:MAG: hypothetical protein ABF289_17160 [Clostridiales bacterium]